MTVMRWWKEPVEMVVLRNGPDKAKPAELAIAMDLHRKGYGDASVRTSKRIGRYGDPIYFEWRGRTASGDARLAEMEKRRRRFRTWGIATLSALLVAVVSKLAVSAFSGGAWWTTP